MKSFNYTITDEIGIHARPAGLLVKEAKKYSSKILIKTADKSAEATKLIAIMGLGAKKGTVLTIEVTGDDETAAADAIKAFLESNL